MKPKFNETIWQILRDSHNSILQAVKSDFESTTKAQNPLMLLVRETELEASLRISISMPESAIMARLEQGMDQQSVTGLINDFLHQNVPIPTNDTDGPETTTLAVITVFQGTMVKVNVSSREEAESLQINPMEHPDRTKAIVMMFHTLAGTFSVVHQLIDTPEGPRPRTVIEDQFPTIDVIESMVDMPAPGMPAGLLQPASSRLH